MLTQDFAFRLKLPISQDDPSFTGFASTYDTEPDLVGDVVSPGAFAQSILHQGNGYPLLWAHDQSQPLGIGKIRDDPKGLIVDGKLVMDDPVAQRALAHMRAGSVKGLSIGYDVPRGAGKVLYSDDGVRMLKEIKLYEISLVAIPANPKAQVTAVKSLSDAHQLLRNLRDVTQPDVLAALQNINAELQRLLGDDDPDDENENDDNLDPEELAALKTLAVSLKALTI